MAATIHEIGQEKNRVLVVDDFMDEPRRLIEQAARMAPFKPEAETYYPGLRRLITLDDRDSDRHVSEALNALAPLIGKAFGVRRFMPTESSFCMVTRRPETLSPGQRLPHYDQVDPGYFAVLHYLSPNAEVQGGTSFYRHRATGFERISPDRIQAYDVARRRETSGREPPKRYFSDSTDEFERIARFEGKFNRLLVYRGSLLHSGDIPETFAFSADPEVGRLTCNIFIQGVN